VQNRGYLYPIQDFRVGLIAISSPPIDRSTILNNSGFWLFGGGFWYGILLLFEGDSWRRLGSSECRNSGADSLALFSPHELFIV